MYIYAELGDELNWSTIFLPFFYAVIAFLRGSRDLPLRFYVDSSSARHVSMSLRQFGFRSRYGSKGKLINSFIL